MTGSPYISGKGYPIEAEEEKGKKGVKNLLKIDEWNKMKTPTRILVGGPEVTSAFVLMALALARKRMAAV